MNTYYPVYLDLRGRRCVVIGGNAAAEEKVRGLLRSGALVELVSLQCTSELSDLAQEGKIAWQRRGYQQGDLAGAFLAIVADTSDEQVNQAVRDESEERGCLLNVVDVTRLCNFIAPAIVRRGPVTVALSTGGLSPALARKLREELERSQARGSDCCISWADAGELVGEVRAELRRRKVAVSSDHWQACLTPDLLEQYLGDGHEAAKQMLLQLLEAGASGPAKGGE